MRVAKVSWCRGEGNSLLCEFVVWPPQLFAVSLSPCDLLRSKKPCQRLKRSWKFTGDHNVDLCSPHRFISSDALVFLAPRVLLPESAGRLLAPKARQFVAPVRAVGGGHSSWTVFRLHAQLLLDRVLFWLRGVPVQLQEGLKIRTYGMPS